MFFYLNSDSKGKTILVLFFQICAFGDGRETVAPDKLNSFLIVSSLLEMVEKLWSAWGQLGPSWRGKIFHFHSFFLRTIFTRTFYLSFLIIFFSFQLPISFSLICYFHVILSGDQPSVQGRLQ